MLLGTNLVRSNIVKKTERFRKEFLFPLLLGYNISLYIYLRKNERLRQMTRHKEPDVSLDELRIVKEVTQAMTRKQEPRSVVQRLDKERVTLA